ncbi:hypothetical protein Pth03_30740 [Planotetraspora thailandica]|uniref:DUF1109 domain-containing protein n=2 Tax=Planotetraspora thailandica TaxID=487172 RepID=A0A8J3V1W4_9ACTN|nr:hypothetical protein Pth03_30740 [Planotetraspora thailandica]
MIGEGPKAQPEQARSRWLWLWFAGLPGLAAASTLVASAPPGGDFSGGMIAADLWLLVAVAWLTLLLMPAMRRSRWTVWAPIIGVLTAILVSVGVPTRLAFMISEPALVAFGQSLPEDDADVSVNRFVGVFSIETVRRDDGVLYFDVNGTGGMLTQCGLAYAPGVRATDLPVSTADHLSGDWYATCTDFD